MHPINRNLAGLFGILILAALLVPACASLFPCAEWSKSVDEAVEAVKFYCEGVEQCDALDTLEVPEARRLCASACEGLALAREALAECKEGA